MGFWVLNNKQTRSYKKKAKVTKSEGCSLEVLVTELCSEIRVGKAQVPGRETKTKSDGLECKVDVSNQE